MDQLNMVKRHSGSQGRFRDGFYTQACEPAAVGQTLFSYDLGRR